MADEKEITLDNLVDSGLENPAEFDNADGPAIGLMMDIESLDLGPRSVVTQIAIYGWDMDEGTLLNDYVWNYMPIQPQLDLIHPRTISASTLWWWMQQSDEARAQFEYSVLEDFENLTILMKHLTVGFKRMVGNQKYELWARGPQFDVTNVESLYRDCGMHAPWEYDTVRDIRTLMSEAGLSSRDVEPPKGFIAHQAGWDCRFQIKCYMEAKRQLRSRG